MAGDQTIALQVKDQPQDFNVADLLSNAQKIEGGQSQLQMLQRQNSGQDIQFRNQLISNAVAHALDSDSWDSAMRQAVQKGAPEAGQFIGRYTPLLQQRLFSAYGGAPAAGGGGTAASGLSAAAPGGAGGAAPAGDMMDRMYQNVPPEQMSTSLQKNNAIISAMSTVKDEASYNAALQRLQAAGIPNAAQLAGPYNPLNVVRLYNDAMQRSQYLQSRLTNSATGGPNPLIKNDVEKVGDVAYSVDPYSGTAKAMTPPDWKTTETTDAFGQKHSIAYNPKNPNETVTVRPSAPADASPYADFAAKMDHAENGTGNPAAKNPLSSATGDGQFINSTWLSTIKSARPDLAKGMSDQQLLVLRADPVLSKQMTEEYARQNASDLEDKGLPVTSASLALAHRFGSGGATTILNAPSSSKLSDILPKAVIDANPSLANMTAGQYVQSMVRQFGNAPMNAVKTPTMGDFDTAKIDPKLTGWDYAAQFPTEVQNAARAYMNGEVIPTGNSRNQGIGVMAKMVAQKVASDLGRPELADDTLYPQRRQMQVELAKTTAPASIGGQITFGGTALGHLAEYSEALADLHNRTGWITPIGHLMNKVGALSSDQSEKINEAEGIAAHYGQEIAKFYGGGPGGVAERERFLNSSASMNPGTATPQEMAGMVRAERNLIPERYAQIKANIENVLGPEAAAKAIARINIPVAMDRINKSLATLDPNGPEARALKGAGTGTAENTPAPNAAALPKFSTPDEVHAAIAAGTIKPGAQFVDAGGTIRQVPE